MTSNSLFLSFILSHPLLHLHSFPTRRSSDLAAKASVRQRWGGSVDQRADYCVRQQPAAQREQRHTRSEEHTSELQSRGHLVCRLLLEKKKKIINFDI